MSFFQIEFNEHFISNLTELACFPTLTPIKCSCFSLWLQLGLASMVVWQLESEISIFMGGDVEYPQHMNKLTNHPTATHLEQLSSELKQFFLSNHLKMPSEKHRSKMGSRGPISSKGLTGGNKPIVLWVWRCRVLSVGIRTTYFCTAYTK